MPAPRAFRTAAQFRKWLAANHARASELEVRVFKAASAELGMTNKEAVDEALCHGWIDGVRHRIDEVSFKVRFTPRTPKSIWSRINLARVEELIAEGRMAKPGLAAYRGRDEKRAGLYSFERLGMELTPAYTKQFRASPKAWAFYQAQPPGYRKLTAFYVMSAKKEETRARRLGNLMACSAAGRRVGILDKKK